MGAQRASPLPWADSNTSLFHVHELLPEQFASAGHLCIPRTTDCRTRMSVGIRFRLRSEHVHAFQMGVDVGPHPVRGSMSSATPPPVSRSCEVRAASTAGRGALISPSGGTAADSATSFDSSGRLIGGWSPSYIRRHLYVAYMGGAHIIQIEPAVYYYSGTSQLNPFGQMMMDFANFSLIRHRDVGAPVAPMALMLDFYSGFDTKHGLYNQADAVWYQDIPYSSGRLYDQQLLQARLSQPLAPWHRPRTHLFRLARGTRAFWRRGRSLGRMSRCLPPAGATRWM